MKIEILVKTGKKESKVEPLGEGRYRVFLQSKPIENKANFVLLEVMSEYFQIPISKVEFVSGRKSTRKILKLRKSQ